MATSTSRADRAKKGWETRRQKNTVSVPEGTAASAEDLREDSAPVMRFCSVCRSHSADWREENGRVVCGRCDKRRGNGVSHAPKAPSTRTPKAKHPCACGCGSETGGTWAQGHDARFYGIMRKVNAGELEREAADVFPTETVEKYGDNAHANR